MSRTSKQRAAFAGRLGVVLLAAALLSCGEGRMEEQAPVAASSEALIRSVLPAQADTSVRLLAPYSNDGRGTQLSVSSASVAGLEHSLIRFNQADIAARVGSAPLTAAYLEVTVHSMASSWAGGDVAVHAMGRSWDDVGATWACADDFNTSGFFNFLNDCNLSDRWGLDLISLWPSPYAAAATDTARLFAGGATTIRFDVTSDVRRFLTGAPNHGWIIKGTTDLLSGSWVQFGSMESPEPPRLVLETDDSSGGPLGEQVVKFSVGVDQDTYVTQRYPDANRSTETRLKANSDSSLYTKHSLVEFDFAAIASRASTEGVTADHSLRRAKLIFTTRVPWTLVNLGQPMTVHPMKRAWNPARATWRCASDTNLGNSTTDCLAADRWSFSDPDPATRPFGGASDSQTVTKIFGEEIAFDVTSDVSAILDGRAANHGWLVRKIDNPWIAHIAFYSKEGGIPPRLELEYHYRRCSPDTPCSSGEGHCEYDVDCEDGLVCQTGIEGRFDQPEGTGVCWDPVCASDPSLDCGTASSRCGECCVPSCAPGGPSCAANGCGGSCGTDCDVGQGCGDDAGCRSGLVCGERNGAAFNSSHANVCWRPSCESQGDALCGNYLDPCGRCLNSDGTADACQPDCSGGRSCGSNGCNGVCGDGGPCELVLSSYWESHQAELLEDSPTADLGAIHANLNVSSTGPA
jgi:hypothetical protein